MLKAEVLLSKSGSTVAKTIKRETDLRPATFIVDHTRDTPDATLGDTICANHDGLCTLRAAIQEANLLPGADIIVLPAGLYHLSVIGSDGHFVTSDGLDMW